MKRYFVGLAAAGCLALAACSGANDLQCPTGQVYDGQHCVHQLPQCPPGQVWNGYACAVAAGPQCPVGTTWNGQACVAAAGPQCPAGQSWNGSACVPPATAQCPPGQSWNGSACVPAAAGGSQCGQATTADAGAAGALLTPVVAQHVPAGAQPVGGAIYGNFQPGQCVQQPVQLQPGKCYTAVGLGQPGVSDLDVQLVIPSPIPGIPAPPIAQDQTQGPTAVLGEKPNCFQWSAPMPATANLVVRVTAGQGAAAAQLYAK